MLGLYCFSLQFWYDCHPTNDGNDPDCSAVGLWGSIVRPTSPALCASQAYHGYCMFVLPWFWDLPLFLVFAGTITSIVKLTATLTLLSKGCGGPTWAGCWITPLLRLPYLFTTCELASSR